MTFTSLAQLEQVLNKRLEKAMETTSRDIKAKMYEETGKFYTQGSPDQYRRTGALGDTPRTTALTRGTNCISFEAYLDQNHNYTTGTFSMQQVMERAESTHFRSGILGRPKFWTNTKKAIPRIINKNVKSYFG